MKIRNLVLLSLSVVVLLTACSKKGPAYTRYIPKDASYVMAFDVKSMMTKLDQDSLSMENMLEVLKNEQDAGDYTQALEMWKQFKDAGWDIDSKVLVAVPELDVTKGSMNFQLVAGLKDASKLEAFVTKLPNAPKVVKDGDLSIVTIGDVVMGWNKKTVMLVGAERTPNYGMVDADSLATTEIPGKSNHADELKKFFELSKDKSLASVDEFGELMEQKADVAVFTNSAALSGPGANPMLSFMPRVKELIEGIYSTTIINFEDGKIVMKSDTYAGKNLAALLSKYAGPVVDMSLVERYPSSNVNGVAAFSFKPELIPAFLKETGLDAIANVALASGGTSIDEVSKALKGDFAIIFSDFEVSTIDQGKDASYRSYQPKGKLLVAMRIGDKAAFDKLMGMAEKQGMVRREGNRIYPAIDSATDEAISSSMFVGVENDLLLFATDSATYSGYAAGKPATSLAGNAKVTAALKNKSVGFYMDATSIMKGIPEAVFDTNSVHEKNILNRSKNVFQEMWFNSANFDGKKLSGEGEVVLAPGKNALPQLVRYLMFIADEMKQKEKEDEEMYKKIEAGHE